MRALAGPRQDLDDLVQAAAERALKALERFEGRSALSPFTYGIVYRTLLDHQRWYRAAFSVASHSTRAKSPTS